MAYVRPDKAGSPPTFPQLYHNDPTYVDTRRVGVEDVRGSEDRFTFDKNGFQFFRFEAARDVDYGSEGSVQEKYLTKLEEFLKQKLGATTIKAFNHIIRNKIFDTKKPYSQDYRGPATRPHIDVTSTFAPFILMGANPDLNADISSSKKRWQIINAWRPLAPIRRDPLAVIDATSLRPEDNLLVPNPEQGPVAESWFTRAPGEAGAGHRWCYMSGQREDEMVVFRQYDSEGAVAVPHTAVGMEGVGEEEPRRSIEVRLFAVY